MGDNLFFLSHINRSPIQLGAVTTVFVAKLHGAARPVCEANWRDDATDSLAYEGAL